MAGRRLGALNLSSHETDGFDQLDEELISLFTAPAAAAIVVMRRYSEARDLAAQLEQALRSRAVIDHAIGIIMAESRCRRQPSVRGAEPGLEQSQHEAPRSCCRDRHASWRGAIARFRARERGAIARSRALNPLRYLRVNGSKVWLKSQVDWAIPEQVSLPPVPGQPPLSRSSAQKDSSPMPLATAQLPRASRRRW